VSVAPLDDAAWRVLARRAPDRSWIAVLDPLPESRVAEVSTSADDR